MDQYLQTHAEPVLGFSFFRLSVCSFVIKKENDPPPNTRRSPLGVDVNGGFCAPAIRFGRMPQAEKLKLKAENKMVEKEEASPMPADHKVLVRQIHDAYMKNFTMNKAKARLILTGKTSKPVNVVSISRVAASP